MRRFLAVSLFHWNVMRMVKLSVARGMLIDRFPLIYLPTVAASSAYCLYFILAVSRQCVKGVQCFFGVVRSDRNSGSSDLRRHTLEVLHRALDLFLHQCVRKPSFCSQVLVILTVLQEVFLCHGWCITVAGRGFSSAEFCEHLVPRSWVSSPHPHFCYLILSRESVETVPVFQPSTLLSFQCYLCFFKADRLLFHW